MNLHNCHIHTFRDIDVPDRFLPFALVRILRTTYGNKLVTWLLKHLIPFTDNDLLDRYAKFASIGSKHSQEEILTGCSLYYPENTKFVVLAMDLAYMKAGRVKRQYRDQLEELSLLAKQKNNIYPFIHIDPRREGVYDLLRQSVEELGFKGIKIYPNIGYFPNDERLYPIYSYCVENGLPVIAHGSPRNSVYFRGSRKELLRLLSNSLIPINSKRKTKKELCSYFSHPTHYEHVVKDFPSLKYCIAHFGSEHYWREYLNSPGSHDNWLEHIQRIIAENENAYTDVSFTMNSTDLFPLLKILMVDPKIRTKVLFGSDYYMVETKASERMFGLDLRAFLGEDFFKDIAETNPKRFLAME